MAGSSDIYRGHRYFRTVIIIAVTIIAAFLAAAVTLFFALQKYAVVTPDGVKLILPFMETETPQDDAPEDEPSDAEIIIDSPDYEGIDLGAGENLQPINAVFVAAENINEAKITAAANTADANAVVLELKPESGQLAYKSSVETATAYAVSGELDISGLVTQLKEAGVYLAAQLSVCADDLMSRRDTLLAVKSADGSVYETGDGKASAGWLDVYNSDLREYYYSLIDELYEMGFDEIILSNLAFPSAEGLAVGGDMSARLTPSEAVANFARALKTRYQTDGPKLSLLLDEKQLRGEESDFTGQDVTLLTLFFDRFCVQTTNNAAEGDKALACADMTETEADSRFVPVLTAATAAGNWILRS